VTIQTFIMCLCLSLDPTVLGVGLLQLFQWRVLTGSGHERIQNYMFKEYIFFSIVK
jgi:ABC-type molybdate transport system permease subunit